MKRLIIIASLAILAVGCQKTEIQNEVQTPIGFSTETGKLTRAIVPNGENGKAVYPTTQPFGVYAYGWQKESNGTQVTDGAAGASVMDNVEISYSTVDAKWAASGAVKYYWPNDPRTTLNFYAYSPAFGNTNHVGNNLAPHETLHFGTDSGDGISHDETNGLILTNYVHSNMYVDFMVADPVIGATYANQTVGEEDDETNGVVSLNFGHEMTQVNFVVKLDARETTTEGVTTVENKYPNVDFTVKSIVLNNIVSQATYEYNETAVAPATVPLKWTPGSAVLSYQIYPVTSTAQAPAVVNGAADTTEEEIVVLRTDATRDGLTGTTSYNNPGYKFNTTPVTMIPQVWNETTPQSFTVTYKISGTGVATEEIVKTFEFADAATSAPTWERNKKITYTLTIGLKEITFAPSVTNWSETDASGSFTDDPSNVPAQE